MKESNPTRLAFSIAAFITLISGITFIIVYSVRYSPSYFSIIGMCIIVFWSSFFLVKFYVERFIYEKIKIIYKTIKNLKRPKDSKTDKKEPFSVNIDNVNRDVEEWAENKSREIDELKSQEQFRREFIGNIFHELKTPVFNIQGYVLTLLDGGLEDSGVNREYLIRTEKSVARLIDIINDLEEISKLESASTKLNFEKFDLVALVSEVCESLEIKAGKKRNSFQIMNMHGHSLNVYADRIKIRQVLVNLIDNALKYGDPKKGKTKIAFFDMDETVLVEITDNGPGIDLPEQKRIFERFYRSDMARARDKEGTGLGLAIVKHIIESHQQTINVRSGLGIGTTFAFTLQKTI